MATKLPTKTNLIKIGRGAALFKPTGEPGAWRFNECPEFGITIETENYTYTSKQSGLSEQILDVPISTTRSANLRCDDMAREVLEAFFAGSTITVTQTSGTVTGETVGPIKAANAYRLGTAGIEGGARKISAVTIAAVGEDFAISTPYTLGEILLNPTPDGHIYVVSAAGTSAGSLPTFPTTVGGTVTSSGVTIKNIGNTAAWVNDTDYSYDPEFGLFNINHTGRIADAIALAAASSGELSLELGYTRAAASFTQLKTGAATSVTGELWFYEEDPINNERKEWRFPDVTLTPAGELALITDEARGAIFAASINKPETLEAIYCNGAPYVA